MDSTDPDDPRWKGMLLNGLEGTVLAAAGELVYHVVRRAVAKHQSGGDVAPDLLPDETTRLQVKEAADRAAEIHVDVARKVVD